MPGDQTGRWDADFPFLIRANFLFADDPFGINKTSVW
jgi:hypothetical protein